MRIRQIVFCVAALIVLTGCTVDDVTEVRVGHDEAVRPTSVPASDFSTTPYPLDSFDLDGDGLLGPAEVKAAVISHSGNFEFPPGYGFDSTHFGLEIDRILDTDWRTFSFDYAENIIVPAQVCSWLQYWLDMTAGGDTAAAATALETATQLSEHEALGEFTEPIDAMLSAAAAGDAELVQAVFTRANCHLTHFWSESDTPIGYRVDYRA